MSVIGDVIPETSDRKSRASLHGRTVCLVAFGLLLSICYWPMLRFTGQILIESQDMAHGFFAPIVALFLVWQNRESLRQHLDSPNAWGLLVLGVAALIGVAAAIGASSTIARFAFLGSLIGSTLIVGGTGLLKQLSLPLVLLFYTFPVPAALYAELTLPLQLLASTLSEHALEFLGYSVLREGNVLQMAHQRLSVVEACSGIRSMITLSFFCVVYAHLVARRSWVRVLIFAAAAPAAILVNVLRITVTGMLGEIGSEWTKGLAHDILGWTAFLIGFGLVVLVHMMVRWLAKPTVEVRS